MQRSQSQAHSAFEHAISLVDQMELRPRVRSALVGMLEQFQPHHGIRRISTKDIQSTVEDSQPELVEQYLAIEDQLPSTGNFSYLWVGYHMVLTYRAASLLFPDDDFETMGKKFMQMSMKYFFENPIYNLIVRATSGRLSDVVEVIFRDNAFTNFAEVSLHRDDTRHYQVFVTETYSDWTALLLGPFAERLFEEFGVEGRLTVDKINPHTIEIDIRWD